MSNQRFDAGRMRAMVGGAVAMVSLAAAGVLVGVGFAAGGPGSPAADQYGRTVICHHTHSKKHPQVTITIAQSAWKAHQRHGDTLGACVTTTTTTTTTTGTTTTTAAASPGQSGQHGNAGGNGKAKGHG
jgi:hypothetical protein